MRLSKKQAEDATKELLSLIAAARYGRRTSELIGTARFHGARTLSNRQVARLLRATGKTRETVDGHGMRTATRWYIA